MKLTLRIQSIFGVAFAVMLLTTGCLHIPSSISGSPKIPNPFGSAPAAPSGYSSWQDYAGAQPGMSVDSNNDLTLDEGTDVSGTPPPSGYANWDDFNNNPNSAPPSGYNTWDEWAAAQLDGEA